MSNEQFLPDNYETPQSGGDYFKFEDGDNRFRVLSRALRCGFIGWDKDGDNRVAYRAERENKADAAEHDENGKPKFFWVLVVWDYAAKRVKILEITQIGIIKTLESLIKSDDWGHPSKYDIVVTKKGQNLKTEYSVQPKPPKKISKAIMTEAAKYKIDLDKLFDNDSDDNDPFVEKPDGVSSKNDDDDDDDDDTSFEEQLAKDKKSKSKSKKKAAEVESGDDDDDDDDDPMF